MFQKEMNRLAEIREIMGEVNTQVVEESVGTINEMKSRGFKFKDFDPSLLFTFTEKQLEKLTETAVKEEDMWDVRSFYNRAMGDILLKKIFNKMIPGPIYKLYMCSNRKDISFNRCRSFYEVIDSVFIERCEFFEKNFDKINKDRVLLEYDIYGDLDVVQTQAREAIMNSANFQMQLISEMEADKNITLSQLNNLEPVIDGYGKVY